MERNSTSDVSRQFGIAVILAGAFALALAGLGVTGAGATQPNPNHKVTLCHRTASYSNPYVVITVDVASVLHGHGHDGHNGPVFFSTIPKHEKWGDIIPPFDYGPGEQYAGKNWTPGGQAIWNNGCKLASATTTTMETTTSQAVTTTSGATTTSQAVTSTSGSVSTSSTTTTGPPVTGEGVTNPSGRGGATGPTGPAVEGVTAHAGGGTLPFTGSATLGLLGAGVALVASGLGLVLRRRRLHA